MKVYFTASILGKEQYETEYRLIVETLQRLGIQVLSLVLETPVDSDASASEKTAVYQKRAKLLKQADLVVAETSYSSTSVGYEISAALAAGKPLLALRLKGTKPTILEGHPDSRLKTLEYEKKTLEKVLTDWLKVVGDFADIRFNFFVPPRIVNYLDWVSKEKRIPRSVYLRNLIEKEMGKNEDYNDDK